MTRRSQLVTGAAVLVLALQTAAACTSGTTTNVLSGGSAAVASSAASIAAAPLDAASIAWFDVLCPGLSQTNQVLTESGLAGSAPDVPQQAIVGAVQQASTVIGGTAAQLAGLPPPAFAEGGQVAAGVIGAMQSAATQMTTSASTFAAINPADAAALQAGRNSLQTELLTSLGFLRDLGKIDPAVTTEIAKIPSCSQLAAG